MRHRTFILIAYLFLTVSSYGSPITINGDVNEILNKAGILKRSADLTPLQRKLHAIASTFTSGQHDDAVEQLKSLSRQHPTDVQVWLTLCLAHLGQDELDQSLDAADRCLKLDPNLEGAHQLRGMILTAQWNLDKALLAYNDAVKAAPLDPDSYWHRGRFLVLYDSNDQDRLRSGIRDLNKALELGAPADLIHGLLGLAHRFNRDYEQAERHFRMGVELNPDRLNAARELVSLYLKLGELLKSEKLIARIRQSAKRLSDEEQGSLAYIEALHALAVNASEKEIEGHFRTALAARQHDSQIRFKYAIWLDSHGRSAQTISVLKAGLKLPPLDSDLAAHLAWSLADAHQNLDEARHWLDVARRKYGENDPYLADTEAWIEYRGANYEKAWKALQPGLSLAEKAPEVAYHAGAILAKLGKRAQSMHYLDLCVRSKHQFHGRNEAVALLKELRSNP